SKFLSVSKFSTEERQWFAKAYIREVLRSKHYDTLPSSNEKVEHVHYRQSADLRNRSRYILDWLAELEKKNPRLHPKLPRLNFQQAHQHSKKWQAACPSMKVF